METIIEAEPLQSGQDVLPRILLFDIDGTLITPARRGEYRGLINEKLVKVFGTCGRISEVDFGGKTDLAIYREALECEGITIETIREKLPEIELEIVGVLELMAESGPLYELCPGVGALLEALSTDRRFILSLLTGNVEKLADAKLTHAGIRHHFKSRGAFGGDAVERDHLPEIAAARLIEHLGKHIDPKHFVIIGDTPRDISCARYYGAKVVAVASGKHSVQQLKELGPDAVLEDLSDTRAVVELLAEI